MSKPVYKIHATRDGAWWALEVPELRGVYSQSKRLDQAKAMIQDVMLGVHDLEPDAHELELEMQLEAVKTLRSRGLPQRDVGQVLGVSNQRIAQITSGSGTYKRAIRNPR